MNISKFENFNHINLIIERLHINNDVDLFSDKIYPILKNSNKSTFEFTDLPTKLNIRKLVIQIRSLPSGVSGQLDLDRSRKLKNGWSIHIDFKRGFRLHNLKHELNHALRLTLIGKDNMIKNLNHIKAKNIFGSNLDSEIEYFFYLMYLANDEEINSKVIETGGLVKEVISKLEKSNLTRDQFEYIIRSSDAFRQSQELIDFSCSKLFQGWDENILNKLFCLLEDEKVKLDKIQDGKFTKFRLFFKMVSDLLRNKTGFEREDNKIYNPKRGIKFYDNWIPSQGEKLRKRIFQLYDHYR